MDELAGYRIAIDGGVIEVWCERCGFLPSCGPVLGAMYDGMPLDLLMRDVPEAIEEHQTTDHNHT